MRDRFFDSVSRRLVYVDNAATADFREQRWQGDDLKGRVKNFGAFNWLCKLIHKFLWLWDYKVLDGWSGIGNIVYALKRWWYDAYGVDYAVRTNNEVRRLFPELKIVDGDVTSLPFGDNFFDAYYSGGVIEHFYFWYDSVIREMYRVLKPWWFAFVTFPYMSPLRKLMAKLWFYKPWSSRFFDEKTFYQFALDADSVISDFRKVWFSCAYKKPQSGAYGIEDDLPVFWSLVKYFLSSNYRYVRACWYAIWELFRPVAGHAMLLVLQKN